MHSGIYALVNTINGKIYIGSSKNLIKRQEWHNAALKRGKPINGYLKTACEKYSSEAFSFIIIEYCDISLLQERELFHIERTHPSLCYNIRRDANRMGGDFKMHSDEVKEYMRVLNKKKYDEDPNHPLKRKFVPDEMKKKISESNKKVYNTPEMKAWASAHRKKHFEDPENVNKNSEAIKKYFEQPGAKEKASDLAKKRNAKMGKEKMMEIAAKREATKLAKGLTSPVVNTKTGKWYPSIGQALKDSGYTDYATFRRRLIGVMKNPTSFKLEKDIKK